MSTTAPTKVQYESLMDCLEHANLERARLQRELSAALSQSQQPAPAEPVAWRYRYHADGAWKLASGPAQQWAADHSGFEEEPLYLAAAAVQPPVVPLTESDIRTVATCYGRRDMLPFREPGTMSTEMVNTHIFSPRELTAFARAIEAKVRGIGSVPPSANPDSVHQERRSGGGVRTERDDSSGSV